LKKYKIEELSAEKKGNTIKFNLVLEDGWNNSVTVKVKSPSNFNFDLKSTGGNISIESSISGSLAADTDGGNVSFDNVNGKVRVSTNGGNISGEDVTGEIKLHTNGGNISLGNVKKGKTEVDTYGGNISVGSVASDLEAKTHGGNINIGDVGGSANVFTYGGHISMDKVSGSAKMETYGGHLNLEGASGDVVAKTMGGHINLENITGSIDANTMGGHVNAELDPKAGTNSSLETSGGNMELKIPANAKATIFVKLESDEIDEKDADKLVRSDFEATTFNIGEDEITATYLLNGGGAKISLKCVGGEVKIKKWIK
ncbi:MAG: hypothetical protein OQJ81_11665, partial [Melioribacteraceae bacterium]|nr:hypothetical protein [Melioribacteraceae bacterium]